MYSLDGLSWSPTGAPSWLEVYNVTNVGSIFIALGDGRAHSSDLNIWTEDEASSTFDQITTSDDLIVASGYDGSMTLSTSTDGIIFTPQTPPTVDYANALVHGDKWLGFGHASSVSSCHQRRWNGVDNHI